MKRSGLIITAGILIIIAGALSLIALLLLFNIAKLLNAELQDIMLYLLPLVLIIQGIQLLARKKIKKSELIIYGIVLLFLVVVQYFFNQFLILGIIQCVLIIIAAILCFAAPAYNVDNE